MAQKEMTGRKVFLIAAGAFGVIISVNLVMAFSAVSTFPGLEVKNSYVASQSFDVDRAAQEALGWHSTARFEGKELVVEMRDMAGNPLRPEGFSVMLGRTTVRTEDRVPEFSYLNGAYRTPADVGSGKWELRVSALAPNGVTFRQRLEVFKPEDK